MSDVTQDEIDALMQEGGAAAGAVPGGPAAVSTLDLARPERSLRGELPGLEVVLERLTRSLRTTLRAFLGAAPTVSVAAVELVRFGHVIEHLAAPISLQLLSLPPIRGTAVLGVPAPFAAAVLEVAFGGSRGRQTVIEGRDHSPIELRALERAGARVLQDLVTAWRPIAPLEGTLVRSEINPAYAPMTERELVLQIELAFGIEGAETLGLSLCLPWAGLDALRARLAVAPGHEQAVAERDERWNGRLRAVVGETELELTAELGRRQLSVRQVLALRVGDVLSLGTGREGPVLVRVEGRPRFLGAPGISGNRHAVQLTARL